MGFILSSKLEKMKTAFRVGNYEKALMYAEKIKLDDVHTAYDLSMMAEVYNVNSRFKEAKDIYIEMYKRNKSVGTCKEAIKSCIKTKCVKQAVFYIKELASLDADDYERYIYQYQVGRILKQPDEYLIACLKKVREADYIDIWAMELAKLYFKNDMTEECIAECHNIKLWFPDTKYNDKADILIDACKTGKSIAEAAKLMKLVDGKTAGTADEEKKQADIEDESFDDAPDEAACFAGEDSCEEEEAGDYREESEDDYEEEGADYCEEPEDDYEEEGADYREEPEGDYDSDEAYQDEYDENEADDELYEDTYFEDEDGEMYDGEYASEPEYDESDEYDEDDCEMTPEEFLRYKQSKEASPVMQEITADYSSDNEQFSDDEDISEDYEDDEDELRLREEYYRRLAQKEAPADEEADTSRAKAPAMEEISLNDEENEYFFDISGTVQNIMKEEKDEAPVAEKEDIAVTLINDSLTADVLKALLEQEEHGIGDVDFVDESVLKMISEDEK
ncbi:MAG: hypothetical protein PUB67_00890 [Clostridiales bacterium]|nr:hypothetical protein [Clostridiales bacterium]